ncbi:MAG: hypothetical protein RSA87_02980 [Malacoplasma sp.]
MISPKVVVKTQFNFATNNKSHKTKLSNAMVRGMFNYFSDNEKRAVKMIDYYTGKINKHENINLIIEDGSYATDDELKNRKNRYSKYIKNSNLWQVIVSFNNEHIDSSIKLEDLEQLMIKKIIPDFIRDCRFEDLSKMSYQTSLHSNTDNYHFHFSFIEKSPNSRNSENKLVYRKVGTIPMLAIDNLKRNILLSIDREKVFKPLLIETNEEIQKLKSFFKEDEHNFVLKNKKGLILENKILKLGKLLYNKNLGEVSKIKYNSIYNKQIKNLTYEIKKDLFTNRDLKDEEKEFRKSLNNINLYYNKLNKENNISSKNSDKSLIDSKLKYIDNYVCNVIVNHANKMYRNEIKSSSLIKDKDIINEVILSNYKKNIKQSRYNILYNYLSNLTGKKYINKYKIVNAIKSINSELEEAQREFSKLFNEKDKSL